MNHAEQLRGMFATCQVRRERWDEVNRIVDATLRYRPIYEQVRAIGVPWWFVGAVHLLESGADFTTHLHNGDPLTARTVHVPAGRPVDGDPPFTWQESAIDAMRYKSLDREKDWSIPAALDHLEHYNGLGYRRRGLVSPYLWSFSNHYDKGKFIADGTYSPTAVSQQCGGGTMWRAMVDRGILTL